LSTQVDTAWVRRYNGPGNGYDVPYAIAVDNSGNVYVSGYSIGVGSEQDFVTIKYSSDGQVTWIQSYNGPGNGIDVVNDMVLDNAGNIYVAGYSLGAGSDKDMTTIKYYPNGDTAWVRRYNAPANGTDGVDVITLDNAGNVYVAGWVLGPGTGTDFATIKYYPNGDTAWVRTYNGTNNWSDYIYDLAVDNAGNVYVTGWSDGVGSYSDYVTIKYYPNGDTAWVRRYNGPGNSNDSPNAIAVDNAGNVYVSGGCWGGTGTSYDITTIKYYPNGTTAWLKRYNGPGSNADWVWDMTFDNAGYLYIAGGSMGSGTYYDYITIKYDSNGDTIWLRNYNGPGNNNDVINRITVEDDNDVFVTGYSLNTGGNFDFATIKYNSAGVQMWVIRYDGPANDHDYANAIAVDNLGYVYVTGNSIGSGTEYDYTTIKYEDLVGIGENHLPLPIHAEGIEIYPNPACNHFNILLPRYINEAQFKVFNVFGEEVKEFTFKKHGTEYRVPLVGINPGVYFVQVRGESIPKKIVVTK
jgi:uncharacterized delta-60 repeat protein